MAITDVEREGLAELQRCLALSDETEREQYLAERVRAILAWVADVGCCCDGDYEYASLADHDRDCPGQAERLLGIPESAPVATS